MRKHDIEEITARLNSIKIDLDFLQGYVWDQVEPDSKEELKKIEDCISHMHDSIVVGCVKMAEIYVDSKEEK